jgi:hypothetical protein
MSTAEHYREQAARCRRLAARVLDKDLQQRLLALAEEYERKIAELPEDDRDGRVEFAGDRTRAGVIQRRAQQLRILAARSPNIAKDLRQIAEDLESEAAELARDRAR